MPPTFLRPLRRAARATPDLPPPAAPRDGHGPAFVVFLVVNAFLFVRPSDVIPAIQGDQIYQYVIGLCLLLALPALMGLLAGDRLLTAPVVVCVLALLPITVASATVNLGLDEAWTHGFNFAKIIAYFLLLVALVTTPRRMKIFVGSLVVFATVMATMSILDFYKYIELPRPAVIDGRVVTYEKDRMYGPGLFGDPNDLCTILATMLLLTLGLLANSKVGMRRVVWMLPAALLGVGFALTQSRGGLLALLAGLALLIRLRFGWFRAITLGAIGFPALLLVLGGRQTALSAEVNTGQERIQLWSGALDLFRESPIFGVGPDQFKGAHFRGPARAQLLRPDVRRTGLSWGYLLHRRRRAFNLGFVPARATAT